MIGHRLDGRLARPVPFDRPIECAHDQHAYETEIDITAQRSRLLRFGKYAPPEFGVGIALPGVATLHVPGDLAEDAHIGGRVIVMFQERD